MKVNAIRRQTRCIAWLKIYRAMLPEATRIHSPNPCVSVRIDGINEIKASGRRGYPSPSAVSTLENRLGPVHFFFARADGKQDTHDIAHHALKKRIGQQIKPDPTIELLNVEATQFSNWTMGLTGGRTVSTKVVPSQQCPGSTAHTCQIKCSAIPGHQPVKVSRGNRSIT